MLDSHSSLFGLGCASELMVVGLDGQVHSDRSWAAASWPALPDYRGGNFIAFNAAPGAGDLSAWETVYATHFAGSRSLSHRTYTWSLARHGAGTSGVFVGEGFSVERTRVFAGQDIGIPAQRKPGSTRPRHHK